MKKLLLLLSFFVLFLQIVHAQRQTTKGWIKAGNLQVYYERTGKGEPLLLFHAGLQDHTMWAEQVKTLSKQYLVITPDLPFHGLTKGVDTTLLVQEVIKTLLDTLHLQKVSVAGLSMGASVAQDFMIAYPERVNKAILISAGINGYDRKYTVDSASMKWYYNFADALDNKDTIRAAKEFTRAWAEGIYRSRDSLKTPVSKYVYQTTLRTLRQHKIQGWPMLQNSPAAIESLQKIQMPVLIIDGDKDLPYITTTSQYLQKSIATSQRIVMKDVAHMLNMEKPDELNKLILDFLKNK